MRNEWILNPTRLDNPAEGRPMATVGPCVDPEDYDLRETLNDIVVRETTFLAFRTALDRFRGRLH